MKLLNNKGISYVELLIVIAIASIVVGFSTISINTIYRNDVGRSADKVFSALNQARNNAMTKGNKRGYIVFCNIDGVKYYRIGENILVPGEDYPELAEDFYSNYNDWIKICGRSVGLGIGYGYRELAKNEYMIIGFEQSTGSLRSFIEPSAHIQMADDLDDPDNPAEFDLGLYLNHKDSYQYLGINQIGGKVFRYK